MRKNVADEPRLARENGEGIVREWQEKRMAKERPEKSQRIAREWLENCKRLARGKWPKNGKL